MAPNALVLTTPPPPGLQEATKNSTTSWQTHLEELFRHAKERFPDVVWELTREDDDLQKVEEVWGHKAVVYARAPPSFQSRYFSFRPNHDNIPYSSSPTGTYPPGSAVSLGLGLDISAPALSRTPSPFRSSSPTQSTVVGTGSSALLRLSTSINPALFSNELEYLYTGQGFGEAFEFLFDSSDSRDNAPIGDDDDPEALRIDKLRKDLVFMWRSRLYSDVRISLTGNFSSTSHEDTTAIFSSHRFILVSRSPYFHTALLAWPSNKNPSGGEPPTLTLPSPPFTPASLHFTLGFIYTGTLIFSHRTYDLSTAFAILRSAHYLSLITLHDEIQARIAQEMMHGLFHAFLPFAEYERVTGGRWGTGGCRCRQCARRAPRVLEFAIADDVDNKHLERGARRALVGMFGEGWCTQEFSGLPPKLRESLLKGVGKRTTPLNVFALLFAAEHALGKLGSVIEPWGDIARDMIFGARRVVEEVLTKESEACFANEDWVELMENDGVRFEDGEKVEWVMAAVLRGVKEAWAATLYQTLVSNILLRPHPSEHNQTLLSMTSHVRVQVEETRIELLKWIGKRWIAIRHERGFDPLEGWALKEISDHIEVPIDDLLNPHVNSPKHKAKTTTPNLLRPTSAYPHTSRVDADDAASSMRVSVLSRHLPVKRGTTPTRETASIRSGLSTSSRATSSTVGRGEGVSPARKIANAARSGASIESLVTGPSRRGDMKDRPDSKLTPESSNGRSSRSPTPTQPSIIEPDDEDEEPVEDTESFLDADGQSFKDATDGESILSTEEGGLGVDDEVDSQSVTSDIGPPLTKTVITRASLANIRSNGSTHPPRPKSSASSVHSRASTIRKSSGPGASLRPPPNQTSASRKNPTPRSDSRGSTRTGTSRAPARPKATSTSTATSRPASRVSLNSVSSSARPTSSVSTSETFKTASTGPRSRRTSAASATSVRTTTTTTGGVRVSQSATSVRSSTTSTQSSVRPSTASQRTLSGSSSTNPRNSTASVSTTSAKSASSSLAASRQRKVSTASINSVGSSVPGTTNTRTPKRPIVPPVPTLEPGKLTPGRQPATSRPSSLRSVKSNSAIAGSKSSPEKKLVSLDKTAQLDEEKENKAGGVEMATTEADEKEISQRNDDAQELTPTTMKPRTRASILADSNAPEHKKSGSNASTISVATLKRKGSADTITTGKAGSSIESVGPAKKNREERTMTAPIIPKHARTTSTKAGLEREQSSKAISQSLATPSHHVPDGVTLDIGIPCIISSKRKRFKAFARYIGEVAGEVGPWVGVEVPMPLGDGWSGDRDRAAWEGRQWNDGSWGGIRYFEIRSAGSEWDYGDDRAARRRRLDVGSASSIGGGWIREKGILKREGDQLHLADRSKRVRSASPSVSDASGAETRGLFVRPQQVLYVIDAVGQDL